MTARATKTVRYVSPFGSPAWMTREEAERYMAIDDDRWLRMQEAGVPLTDRQREIGCPRIELHPDDRRRRR